jgi:hypothetical protein
MCLCGEQLCHSPLHALPYNNKWGIHVVAGYGDGRQKVRWWCGLIVQWFHETKMFMLYILCLIHKRQLEDMGQVKNIVIMYFEDYLYNSFPNGMFIEWNLCYKWNRTVFLLCASPSFLQGSFFDFKMEVKCSSKSQDIHWTVWCRNQESYSDLNSFCVLTVPYNRWVDYGV